MRYSPLKKYVRDLLKHSDSVRQTGIIGLLRLDIVFYFVVQRIVKSWVSWSRGSFESHLPSLMLIQIQRSPSAGTVLSDMRGLRFRDPGHTDALHVCYRYTQICKYIYIYIYTYSIIYNIYTQSVYMYYHIQSVHTFTYP